MRLHSLIFCAISCPSECGLCTPIKKPCQTFHLTTAHSRVRKAWQNTAFWLVLRCTHQCVRGCGLADERMHVTWYAKCHWNDHVIPRDWFILHPRVTFCTWFRSMVHGRKVVSGHIYMLMRNSNRYYVIFILFKISSRFIVVLKISIFMPGWIIV